MRYNVSELPGALPKSIIPDDIQPTLVLEELIGRLPSLKSEDLVGDALWRDSFALTGTLRTFSTAQSISQAWNETLSAKGPAEFTILPDTARISRHGDYAWLEARFTFHTTKGLPQMLCSGSISLVPDSESEKKWKIWVFTTILENFRGQNNVDALLPGNTPRINDGDPSHFEAVVLGGGQAGLAVGGRLQALEVSYVIVDENNEVGGSWMSRYDSLKRNLFFFRSSLLLEFLLTAAS